MCTSITYCGRVPAALGIQHAVRMRHIVMCVLHGYTNFFFTLAHNRHDLKKKVTEH